MKILVTGPDGLLGSNLIRELLRRNYEVTAMTLTKHKPATLDGLDVIIQTGDLLDYERVKEIAEGMDVVIHCAANTSMFPARAEIINRVNIDGTNHVVSACLYHKVQVASVGPMFGQCGHFLGYAPRKIPYAIARYRNETLRLYGVMDRRLAQSEYLAGRYSIADIATFPWIAVRWLHRIDIDEFPHVKRWFEAISKRPAVRRGMALLKQRERIGHPDARTREVFFGKTQLRQGRSPQ